MAALIQPARDHVRIIISAARAEPEVFAIGAHNPAPAMRRERIARRNQCRSAAPGGIRQIGAPGQWRQAMCDALVVMGAQEDGLHHVLIPHAACRGKRASLRRSVRRHGHEQASDEGEKAPVRRNYRRHRRRYNQRFAIPPADLRETSTADFPSFHAIGAHMPLTDPLALYIHWPFCVAKCPYCDFNSHVREGVDQAAWRSALLADLAHEAALLPGRTVGSIFFGGGTPSLMPPETMAVLIDAAAGHWSFADDIEITMEANPNSAEAANFAHVAAAGVNRLSLGLQALDDAALKFLGRAHDVNEALAALDSAQASVDRVSIDLIYARPDQTEAQWEAELARALSFGTDHLSLYQLTIEPGTRFETDVRRGEFTPADPDHAAQLFELTQAMTLAARRPAYEVSNHAAPGQESRHNLAYWRYNDYAGVGPGAHGRRGGLATVRHKKPENWMGAVERNGHGLSQERPLEAAEQAGEALMMGLRLREGIDLERLGQRFGLEPAKLIDEPAVKRLCGHDLLQHDDRRLRATPKGMLLLDGILGEIVAI